MKLKLEAQGNIAILSVFESVMLQDALVLKAGLNKLFQSGKKQVVLDLCAVPAESIAGDAISDLVEIPAWALTFEAFVCIASPIQGIGQAADRAGALELSNSDLCKLLALEAKLTAQLRTLEAKKDQLEHQLAAPTDPQNDIRTLRQQASDLRTLSQSLEEQIKMLLKGRKEPLAGPIEAKRINVYQSIDTLLQHQGVLPPS